MSPHSAEATVNITLLSPRIIRKRPSFFPLTLLLFYPSIFKKNSTANHSRNLHCSALKWLYSGFQTATCKLCFEHLKCNSLYKSLYSLVPAGKIIYKFNNIFVNMVWKSSDYFSFPALNQVFLFNLFFLHWIYF